MPKIRKVKTASGATAVQVVTYSDGKRSILKHVGSAHTDEDLSALHEHAIRYVEQITDQASLFSNVGGKKTLSLEHTRLRRTTHLFARSFFHACARSCGLNNLEPIILDFITMRIIEPSSKLRAIELIERFFGIRYNKRSYGILRALYSKKDTIEQIALSCATGVLKEELFFILYDVTTLYFESFKADDLRSLGFSKDDKSKQPQIVVGLLATKSGFPLAHEVFPGKTFEGRTILPVLEKFSKKHGIEMPIVVADAAMLSKDNIKELGDRKMNYIVGARLANTSPSFIRKVNMALSREDGKIVRFPTNRHGDMICSFSLKRYRKDKLEMEKQIERAKRLIVKNEDGRRAKFVKKAEGAVVFNQELVAKTEELLGIKGYCTNIPESTLSNNQVIEFYHSLWNVEYAFRMSKHDIQARPIFHRESDAVRAHILLCFIALMIGRYLEIISGMSLRKATDLLWSIEEAHLEDTVTHEIFTLRMPLDPINRSPLGDLVKKWNC
jgi:hypothetical protein